MKLILITYLYMYMMNIYAEEYIQPQIPIPYRDPGKVYLPGKSCSPKVKIEVFLELNCPDSRTQWNIMKQVLDYYGSDVVELIIQQHILPNHKNAFTCVKGYLQISDRKPDKAFDYMEAVMEHMEFFMNDNTTESMAQKNLSEIHTELTGLDASEFLADLNKYRWPAFKVWKYAAKRGVAGTPWFFVNNINLGAPPSAIQYDVWIQYLDPLVEQIRQDQINCTQRNSYGTNSRPPHSSSAMDIYHGMFSLWTMWISFVVYLYVT